MHIAVLTDGISPYVLGGMQRHSFHLVKNLLERGLKITLIHTVEHSKELPPEKDVLKLFDAPEDQLRVIGLEFPHLDKFPGHYLRESYRYSCEIFERLKDEWDHFDFIYAKGFTAWCILEKKSKGIHMAPVGVKFHGYEMYQKTSSLMGKLEQFMFKPPVVFNNRKANVVFSYGGEITSIIEKIGVESDRIAEITGGVDDCWLSESVLKVSHPRKFVFVGRNERRKGIADLETAVCQFKDTDVEFHWIGPIPKERQLKQSNCIYHGLISDSKELQNILDQMDVLVLPSHSEGMPNVILEAMSRGCAILATDVGAVSMMVTEACGKLIKPNNKDVLSNALKEFINLEHADLLNRKEMSRKIVAERFLWSEIARQTHEIIEEVTHSSPTGINN